MQWSATQYRLFEDERNRPIRDLLAQLPNQQVAHAADIGCGPGNSTELLQQRFPDAEVIGIDSSEDMIAAAQKRLPAIHFAVENITTWRSEQAFDVILANAVLQWVPNHATLLPRLLANLVPGGSLAVQVPDNMHEPSHRLMREVAADGPWANKLQAAPRAMDNRQSAEWYYRLLREQGAAVNIWRTTFFHPLANAHAIVEWFKGTGLRPYLEPLDEAEREAFLSRYEAAIAAAYPAMDDGIVLLPFPRLFFVATR